MQGPVGSTEAPLFESGELVEVLKDWKAPPLPVSVVFPHGRHLAPRVRIFVDWVAELIAAATPVATAPKKKRPRQTTKRNREAKRR